MKFVLRDKKKNKNADEKVIKFMWWLKGEKKRKKSCVLIPFTNKT